MRRSQSDANVLRFRYAPIGPGLRKGRFHPVGDLNRLGMEAFRICLCLIFFAQDLVTHQVHLPLKPIDTDIAPPDTKVLSNAFKASVHRK